MPRQIWKRAIARMMAIRLLIDIFGRAKRARGIPVLPHPDLKDNRRKCKLDVNNSVKVGHRIVKFWYRAGWSG